MQEDNLNEECGCEIHENHEDCVEGAEGCTCVKQEALDHMQRMAKKQAMKRIKGKIKMGRKRNAKRLKTPEKIKKTAQKKARDMIAKKLVKGKDKKDMSYSQRQSLEKKLAKKKGAIAKLARKLKGKVKTADKDRVKKARSK